MAWDSLVAECLASAQEPCEQVEDAEVYRPESDQGDSADESSAGTSSSQDGPEAWWVTLLEKHTKEYHYPSPRSSSLTLVSGCSGMLAEAFALQELGFSVEVVSVSEKQERCLDIIRANFCVRHTFKDMLEQCALKPADSQHSNGSDHDHAEGARGAVCGTVCAPYSVQREKRFSGGSVTSHLAHALTAEGIVEWLGRVSPEAGVCENVMGWDMPLDVSTSETPLGLSPDTV
ncbi:unnamed protein product [Symbiodinium necroappetens]|uniref:Uncharacterized protein n=1 Tax=Symbiodinium necroappetens TaxID=1628268 RepID=A0A813C1A3_9DINO|nr:unnamed protein product [Symbiodinium necroappetens]